MAITKGDDWILGIQYALKKVPDSPKNLELTKKVNSNISEIINEKDSNKLAEHLSWLLENDDIFGSGIFSWLEILYKLNREIRDESPIKEIFEKYLEVVKTWNVRELIKMRVNICKLSKNLWYIDNEVWSILISTILEGVDLSKLKIDDIKIDVLVSIWTNEAIDKVLICVKSNTNNSKSKQPTIFSKVYKEIIKTEHSSWIDKVILQADKLFDEDEYYNAWIIYREIIKTWNFEVVEKTISCVKKLFEGKEYRFIWGFYEVLLKIWDSSITEMLVWYGQNLIENKEYYFAWELYKELVKIEDSRGIENLALCAEELSKEKESCFIQDEYKADFTWNTYKNAIRTWDSQWNKMSISHAEKLLDEKKYYEASEIYKELIKIWDLRWIGNLIFCMEELFKLWTEYRIWKTYKEIINTWDSEVLKMATLHANKLYEEGEYDYAWEIYKELIKTRDSNLIEKFFLCIEELFNQNIYSYALEMSKELIKLWNLDFTNRVTIKLDRIINENKENEEFIKTNLGIFLLTYLEIVKGGKLDFATRILELVDSNQKDIKLVHLKKIYEEIHMSYLSK